ncbi:hypothetical protein E2C01_007815 [Portunus trituberculatus]|uniref:Uncharacterized protein n=1 Tax=Portunus trituberculatus TaxID=210409 RepID=A0A5B7CZ58_PORTR|nr:hypothetical protein [Portunus trituberculatus]
MSGCDQSLAGVQDRETTTNFTNYLVRLIVQVGRSGVVMSLAPPTPLQHGGGGGGGGDGGGSGGGARCGRQQVGCK